MGNTLIDRRDLGPLRNYVGYGNSPPPVIWPGGAALVVSLVVNYEEGSERSLLANDPQNESLAEIDYLMPPEHRDLTTESVYEYGSRAGVWRLLRVFEDTQVKATFFAAATALERNREVAQSVGQADHEVCSHGWRWEEVFRLTRDQEREHIRWAVESIQKTTGQRPLGWYSRYSPSIYTRELLVEEGGFVYDSDAYNDDLPYYVAVRDAPHLVIPYNNVYNDARYVLAQGYSSPSDFLDYCTHGVDELRREGHAGHPKMLSIGLHPRWAGQAARAAALRQLINYCQSLGDVAFLRRIDIARWWIEHADEWKADS